MTDRELADAAVAQLTATTTTYAAWLKNVKAGRYNPRDGSGTLWGKAFAALAAIDVAPTPPPPPPPPPTPPTPDPGVLLFTDGFANQNHDAWKGGAGGRNASCDCIRTCPGGTPDVSDPLDSYHPDGAGFFRRVTLRPECKSLIASCLNACELVKEWPGYKLGSTEYLAHRVRVTAPYTGQVGFCLLSQFGYGQVKFNALGLNLVGSTLGLYCNLGYSAPGGGTAYQNPQGYEARGGAHPVDVGEWHDYIWQLTYSTIYGVNAASPVPGQLVLWHRKPETTVAWDPIFDSRIAHPEGVPTRQWGYGLGNDAAPMVSVTGVDLNTQAPRKYVDKLGAYRGAGNNTTFTVDHRKFCVATSFATAASYLDASG